MSEPATGDAEAEYSDVTQEQLELERWRQQWKVNRERTTFERDLLDELKELRDTVSQVVGGITTGKWIAAFFVSMLGLAAGFLGSMAAIWALANGQ